MSGLTNKAALPIHVLSWALAIEKESSVACHFSECQFMALSLEDMGKHHAQCLSDNSKYPFVCKTCNRRTDVIEKLLIHRQYSHSYDPTIEEERMIDDYLNKPVKKVITPIIRKYWDLYLEQKKYLKCLWRPCLYVTNNIEDMENHYLNSCKKTYWSKLLFHCEFCNGRLTSDYDLQLHIRTAHESRTYLKSNTHPNTNINCVKVWSREILVSKQGKCFVAGCRFVDNNIKILEKHYASCIGKKRSSYSICTTCGSWLQNDARLKEHTRCFHKSVDDDNLQDSSSHLGSGPETQKNLNIQEMSPEEYDTLQQDVGVEKDNNRPNDIKKYYGGNKVSKKSSNDLNDLSSVLPSKTPRFINCRQTNDKSGIQYNNDIIETNAGILDVINIDSSNVKKVLNDGMKLKTIYKKITRRRSTSGKTKATEKSFNPVSTPLQVFANEIMKENKNSSTVPIQIKVDDKDWTVNVSKTVVTQPKSSDEFPTNREALFQALKDDSYKLLKLISKKNSVRNDVRMVFDPDETRVTPFHINFKINENNAETTGDDSLQVMETTGDDSLQAMETTGDATRLHFRDVESSSEEDFLSDELSNVSKRYSNIANNKITVKASDDNLPSVLDNSHNISLGSDISHYEGPHNDISVIKLPDGSNEEHFLLEPRSSPEGMSQYIIQRLYSNFERSQSERKNNCKISPECENEIKDETATNVQCVNQLYSTDLDCGIPQENFVIKEELNGLTIVPVSSTDQQSVEGINGEIYQNNNRDISVIQPLNNTVGQENVLAVNTFESEYILPDIDYVDNQTSLRCTTERIDMASLDEDSSSNSSLYFDESNEVPSDDEPSESSINEISNNVINAEVNDTDYVADVKLDNEVKLNNDSPSSSFHCLDTNNKGSNQTFGAEKDPLCMDGFNEGVIFRHSETDLFQLPGKNESDKLSDRSDEEVTGMMNVSDEEVTEEKIDCSLDSKNDVDIIGNELSDKHVDDFDSKWNWSTLKKYNSKVAKNISSARMEDIQYKAGKADKKQVEVEDENFLGFSDHQDSSLNYSKFINTCNKLGYYDDMVVFNQHYEVSQSCSMNKNKFKTNKNEIGNTTFSGKCNRMTDSPELSTILKKRGRPKKRPRSYSSPVMSNAISEKSLTQSEKASDVMDDQVCNKSGNSVHSIIKPIDVIGNSKPSLKKKRGRPRKLSLDSLQNKTVDQLFMRRMSLGIQNIDDSSNKNVSIPEVDISSDNGSNPIIEHKIDNFGPQTKRGPGRPKKFIPDIHNQTTPKQISLVTQEIEKQENYSPNQICDTSDNLFDKSNLNNFGTKCNSDVNDKRIINTKSESSEHVEIKSLEKLETSTFETSFAEKLIVQNIKNHNKSTLLCMGEIPNHNTTEDSLDSVANIIDNFGSPVKRSPGRSKKITPKLAINNTSFGAQEIEQENVQLVREENCNISETKCPSDDHSLGNSDHIEIKSSETDRLRLVEEVSNTEEIIINKPGSNNKNVVSFEGDISSPNTIKALNLLDRNIDNSESLAKQSSHSPKEVTLEPQTNESALSIKEVGLYHIGITQESGITINEEPLNTCNKISTIKTKSSSLKIGIQKKTIQKNIPVFNNNTGLSENENEPDRQKTPPSSPPLLNRKKICKRKTSSLSDNYFLNKENDSDLDVDESNNEILIKKVNPNNESASLSEEKNISESVVETAKEDIIDSYGIGAASIQNKCLADNYSSIHQTRNQISCIEPQLKRRPGRPKKYSLVGSQNINQNNVLKTYSSRTPGIEQGVSVRAQNISKNTSHEEPVDKTFLSPLTFIKGMDSNMSVSEMFINDFKKIEGNIDCKVKEIDCSLPKRKRYNGPEVISKPAFAKVNNKNRSENESDLDAKEINEPLIRLNCSDSTNECIGKINDNSDEAAIHIIKIPVESTQSVVQRKPATPEPTYLKDEHKNHQSTRLEELNKTAEVIQSEAKKKPGRPKKQSLEPVCPNEELTVCRTSIVGGSKIDKIAGLNSTIHNEKKVATVSEEMIVTPAEDLQPSLVKRKRGRPKKQSLEPMWSDLESENQSTRQKSLHAVQETDVIVASNCGSINNEEEVVRLETPCTSSERIDTPVEVLQPVAKRKRGRPKKQSLEPMWSDEECENRSTRKLSLHAVQETDEIVASNCSSIKNGEEVIRLETPCTSSERIDTPVEDLQPVAKRKRGRPKKQSLEPMGSNEECENQSTRHMSHLASEETGVIPASNCDSIKNEEEVICVETSSTSSAVKRKRGRPKKQSLEPVWSDEECKNRSTRKLSFLGNQETDEIVASNCDSMKYQEVVMSDVASFSRSEVIIPTPAEELQVEVKRKRGRPKKQSLEPMLSDVESENQSTRQASLTSQETDEIVASNCDSMKYQEDVTSEEAPFSRSEVIIQTPVEELQVEVKRKRGRPKKQSLEPMWSDVESDNQSARQASLTSQETDEIVASNCDSIQNDDGIKLEEMIATPAVVQKKRGRPKKTCPSTEVDLNLSDLSSHFSENVTLIDSESAASVERRVRREKRASALSCLSFIKSEFINMSDADEENQNLNTTSTEGMILTDGPEFISKKKGRKKGCKKNSDHWSTRNRISTKTNYITYNSEDSNVRNSEEIREHTITDSNSTLDQTFGSESDFSRSTWAEADSSKEIAEGDSSKEIAEGDSSKEMANEENQTSKQKARKMKKQLLSGRVDTLTRLKYPNDQVKCAVCGEKMRVRDYQKSHLKKHNFVAWLEGEEPLPVHDIDYMDTVLLRGKRSHPKFIFRCEVCGQLKKSSKGYLSHQQFCGKTEREKEKIMAVCEHCGRIMVPASLAPHIYKHHKPDADPEETGHVNVSRKAAERCLGKIASYIEDDNTPSKNDSENEDFQHDVDGDEEFDEIEEITLLYIPVQKKKANKCLINRWKKHASKKRQIKCPGPSCQFTTFSFDNILEHHKTCIFAGFQGYSCIKCNFICLSEEEIREHVKSCNPPIIVSQSDNSEDEVPEKHVMIPYLRAEEMSLVYQRYKCQFFKPALNWMNKIYTTHFSQEPLFHELKLNIESWKEMDMKASQYFNPEKSKSMRISFQNSPWESMHTLEGKVVDGDEGIAFTGGPVWGLEWCPGEGDQYLAVSSHLAMESNFEAGCTFNGPGIVQLWSLEHITNAKNDPLTTLQFSYSVCHNERACWNMAWCPSGGRTESRIGLLALATTSGSIPIYAMPDPKSLVPQLTRFYKPDPVLKLELWSTERWQCNAICWSKVKPHSIIVAGFVNGVVAVWDLSIQSSLLRKKNILHPFKVFQAHHSIVTGVCLSPENNEYLATTSYDKSFKFWDLKDTTAPQSVLKRGLFTSVDWLRHWMAAVATYDNAYTMLQTSVSLCPLRGFVTPTLQVVNNINSTSWSVTVNDWLNGAISSYDNGQVVLFLALKQTAYHHMEKRKYTKIILKSSLHSFENGDETQNKSSSKKKDEEPDQNNIPSNSYEEAVKKYGLAINTDLAVGKNDKFQSKNSGSLNDIYPMSSINRVAWNTNRQSFLYVAMGYQSGFLVVSKLSFPTVDQHAIDEISKQEN